MQLPSEVPDQQQQQQRGGKAPESPESPSKVVREKPVKVLPCPRCESMNTKFCYYNNYSVAQPRHFCRQCQRYWTAGGTLRNVPVGGGSRKKNRHPRALNEPYLQRGSPPSTFGTMQQQQHQQPGGHFQQMLTHDHNMAGLFPGFTYQHPYTTMDPAAVESMQQGVMYGTASHMHHVPPYFFPTQAQEGAHPPAFPNDVKSEFWQQQPAPQMVAPNKRFESSMLLNLGLNNRQQNKPLWDQSDVKPTVEGAPVIGTKNASPPHGSSTIEEEGSTPTNGYSTSGYEEGDAVSSMWHNLHDMDNIFS